MFALCIQISATLSMASFIYWTSLVPKKGRAKVRELYSQELLYLIDAQATSTHYFPKCLNGEMVIRPHTT